MQTNETYLIGVTGSYGTGKSLVGEILSEFGVHVIDTDHIVKEILASENDISKLIVNEFGSIVCKSLNGEFIDRKELADIVFKDEGRRKKLESFVHPEVGKRLTALITDNRDKKVIAVLIPLLFEVNLQESYNETWCVICKEEIQLKRLKKKGITPDQALSRIKSQMPLDKKAALSDFVINNSDSEENTREQVKNRLKRLAQLNHNFHLFSGK